jgi:hypothetical protein
MAKKHSKKKSKLHGRIRFPWESRSGTAADPLMPKLAGAHDRSMAQTVVAKIVRSGPGYIKDSFVRIMRNSHVLRAEPEFRDLFFDADRTLAVTARILKKHEKELSRLRQADAEEQDVFGDEVRAEIIDELATPVFRKEVLRRLERASERLGKTTEADKYEVALMLEALLEMKGVPWGLCALMTVIYGETLQQAEAQAREDEKIFGEFLPAFEKGMNLEEACALLQDPKRAAELTRMMGAKPGLVDRLQEETLKTLHEFERKLAGGEVELDLFTEAELTLSCTYLEQYLADHNIDLTKMKRDLAAKQFREAIGEAIRETMVPERAREMKTRLEKTSRAWLSADNPMGLMLQIELSYLDDTDHATNPFLLSGFIGQLHRIQRQIKSHPRGDLPHQ